MSCHLKDLKLHFNYFPILDTTVTELATILHPNYILFASKQALTLHSLIYNLHIPLCCQTQKLKLKLTSKLKFRHGMVVVQKCGSVHWVLIASTLQLSEKENDESIRNYCTVKENRGVKYILMFQ